MTDTPEDAMQYQMHNLGSALVAVRLLVEKTKPDTKAHEFYTTIEESMIALQYAMNEASAIRRAYNQMVMRVNILERLLLTYLPAQPLLTHDMIDNQSKF